MKVVKKRKLKTPRYSKDSVNQKRQQRLGRETECKDEWTQEERDMFLNRLLRGQSISRMATALGRTDSSVETMRAKLFSNKAEEYGPFAKHKPGSARVPLTGPLSPSEIYFLKKLRKNGRPEEHICLLLGRRPEELPRADEGFGLL